MAYTNIDDPSVHFQTTLYTGDGLNNKQITNDGNSDLKPDWVWLKDRTQAESNALFDSTRGATVRLQSNNTGAESTETATLKSFTTDGFTVGTSASVNNGSNPDQYVAWQWKANGGTTASNTSGGTTTTVQANQDAGFSIVTWTGNGATTTLGHGLGVKPDVIIVKARGTTSNWAVYHKDATNGQQPYNVVTYLDLVDATGIASNSWGTVASDITSNTFYLKYWFNISSTLVAYCFAEKQGYSKFGKYTGNGNANGPFVYTGFKPAFLMIKVTNTVGNWFMTDHKRNPFNLTDDWLVANGNYPEQNVLNASSVDYLSNGFKLRNSYSETNNYGWSFVYMAFAENPFTTSTGIPTTAR